MESASDPEEKDVVSKLEKVRKILIEGFESTKWPETFGCPITSVYPIKVKTSIQFHGWCEILVHKNEWIKKLNIEKAKEFSILSLTVHLSANPEDNSILPMELLLPTFIHELAHSVTTPEKWTLNSIPKELREDNYGGMKPSDFVILHHSPTFYTNFALLLQMAEKLNIYSLPTTPNKYSVRALKRFDQLDPEASKSGLNIGQSPMFSNKPKNIGCLRLLVTDVQKIKQKPITISDISVLNVLKEAKTKLNLRKKPTMLLDIHGNQVSDEVLCTLYKDTLLIVK